MFISIIIIAAIGLCISLYAFFVERKLTENPMYHPVCDLSDRVSCSKTFISPYGHLFKYSNTIAGAIFYSSMMLLAYLDRLQLIWYGTVAAIIASVIFAYILFFKIRTICLLCISLYLVNVALFITAYMAYIKI